MSSAIVVDRVTKVFTPLNNQVGLKTMLLHPFSVAKEKRKRALVVLDGVSFEIAEGEAFGVIGRNGAGKSTLLGLIGGIIEPTTGSVRVNGRVCPLMELGAGLQPQLSGRENIFLNGVLLGMRRREVEARFDEILEFSGLDKFVEQPLLTYSAGMKLRLAFSVAIHIRPRILMVDEVLAVGDAAFQARCLERIGELRRDGVTLLLVSHSMRMIEQNCDRVAWIERGKVRELGASADVVASYQASVEQANLEWNSAEA